jgi:hypothetical protein
MSTLVEFQAKTIGGIAGGTAVNGSGSLEAIATYDIDSKSFAMIKDG